MSYNVTEVAWSKVALDTADGGSPRRIRVNEGPGYGFVVVGLAQNEQFERKVEKNNKVR